MSLESPAMAMWTPDGHRYYFGMPTQSTLPSGCYRIYADAQNQISACIDNLSFNKNVVYHKQIFDLLNDINRFFNSKRYYQKLQIPHKHGILIHGRPGSGKTSLLEATLVSLNATNNYIIINIVNEDPLHVIDFCTSYRTIDPFKNIIIAFENLERQLDQFGMHNWIQLFDGISKLGNIAFIGTTSRYDLLPIELRTVGGKFDVKYEISDLDSETRRAVVEDMIASAHKNVKKLWPSERIDQVVIDTNNFTIGVLQELLVLLLIYQHDYDEALRNMSEKNKQIGFRPY
mgnify:CR=1 FL=1